MKKALKLICTFLVLVMVISTANVCAFADDTSMNYHNGAGIDTEYYNDIANGGTCYIANVFQGVNFDKTITATKGQVLKLVYGAAESTESDWSSTNAKPYKKGVYSQNSSRLYCINTDEPFWLSGSGINADVSGFGAAEGKDGAYGAAQNNKEILTTFTIDTSNLELDEYDLSLKVKYQFKKYVVLSGWTVEKEFTQIISGFKLKIVDAKTKGSSIRTTNAGLRFGFETSIDPNTVEEFGFIYKYAGASYKVSDITADDENVKKKTATNYVTHNGITSFNLVFTNIPFANYSTYISVKGYVKIDGYYYYTNQLDNCFRSVANAVIADEGIDEPTKNAVKQMLDSVGNNIEKVYLRTGSTRTEYKSDGTPIETYEMFESLKYGTTTDVEVGEPAGVIELFYADGTIEEYANYYLINSKFYIKYLRDSNDNIYEL